MFEELYFTTIFKYGIELLLLEIFYDIFLKFIIFKRFKRFFAPKFKKDNNMLQGTIYYSQGQM